MKNVLNTQRKVKTEEYLLRLLRLRFLSFLKILKFLRSIFPSFTTRFFLPESSVSDTVSKTYIYMYTSKNMSVKACGPGPGGGGLKALADLLIYIYLFFLRLPLLNKPILPLKIKWQSRRTSMAIGSIRPLGKCSKSGTVSIRLNQFLFHGMEYSILITINDKGSEE